MTVLAVTGHRPDKLDGGYSLTTRRALGGFAVDMLYEIRPERVITGMALGWDQAVAGACIALAIPFTAAIPFRGQESRWPAEAQMRYRRLLADADITHIVSEWPGAHAMDLRNRWMVDRADHILALWNRDLTGGTANCIRYAESKRVPITNAWSRWMGEDPLDCVLG